MRYQPAEAPEKPIWALPRAVVVLLGLAGAVVVIAGMKSVAGIIGPTFLALILTVAVHPLHDWLRRKGFPPWVGVAALVVVYGILVGLTVALAVSIAQFATILPDYQAKFDELVARGREMLEARGVGADEVQEALNIDANVVSAWSARSSTAH